MGLANEKFWGPSEKQRAELLVSTGKWPETIMTKNIQKKRFLERQSECRGAPGSMS